MMAIGNFSKIVLHSVILEERIANPIVTSDNKLLIRSIVRGLENDLFFLNEDLITKLYCMWVLKIENLVWFSDKGMKNRVRFNSNLMGVKTQQNCIFIFISRKKGNWIGNKISETLHV